MKKLPANDGRKRENEYRETRRENQWKIKQNKYVEKIFCHASNHGKNKRDFKVKLNRWKLHSISRQTKKLDKKFRVQNLCEINSKNLSTVISDGFKSWNSKIF